MNRLESHRGPAKDIFGELAQNRHRLFVEDTAWAVDHHDRTIIIAKSAFKGIWLTNQRIVIIEPHSKGKIGDLFDFDYRTNPKIRCQRKSHLWLRGAKVP